jgi:polyhydroxyalkanoate synthase
MSKPNQDFEKLFTDIAAANKVWFDNLLSQHKVPSGANPAGGGFLDMYKQFFDNTKTYLESQQKFYQSQMSLWQSFIEQEKEQVEAEVQKPVDKRFSDPDWEHNPFFAYLKQSYLNMSDFMVDFIAKSSMDAETKERLKFFMCQYLDAISPSNFAMTNPEVIKNVVESNGMSLVDGMKNMMEDVQNGYMSMTDETLFEVGQNLAVTKGKVVFKNELIELIQYAPSTSKVRRVPLLVVPPCINKYYILDLQQSNSLVKYLVGQGYTVYLISWKSADKSISKFHWEEYVNLGVTPALDVIRKISGEDKINTLGYCIGGIILTTAYLLLKSKKLDWIKSMGHMTVMLDHGDPGDIKYFLDRDLLELREAQKHTGGVMSGRVISQTFSALRANELIWNYWITKYLMGKTPQAFDILYWNNDAVDLPVLMHAFLLKRLYLHNELVSGKLVIDGVTMDLNKITCPVYLFAAQKDHIVPWHSAYLTTKYVKNSDVRFVLGASGHTAGVVNPVSSDKRNYWVNDKIAKNADEWFKTAKEIPGSWWKDFSDWLVHLSGDEINATKSLGNEEFKPLLDAPGEYVRAKALPITEAHHV